MAGSRLAHERRADSTQRRRADPRWAWRLRSACALRAPATYSPRDERRAGALAGPSPARCRPPTGRASDLLLAGVGAFLIGIALSDARTRLAGRGASSDSAGRGLARLREALFQRALLVVGFTWLAAGFVASSCWATCVPHPRAAFPPWPGARPSCSPRR
jgi:hypothetical protein